MGRSISITAGYGVYIPGSADEDVSFDSADILNSNLKIVQEFRTAYGEVDEEDQEEVSWGELGEYIEEKYPLLSVSTAYFGDYQYGTIIFVQSTVKKEYEGLLLSADGINSTLFGEEEEQLREVVELFEVDYDPQVWVSVSYW